jgi:molybdenum cofactor biosynthesis protein B
MSFAEHRAKAPATIRCYVITVSDTRTDETDTGGRAVAELLTAAGHTVIAKRIVRDEPEEVAALVKLQAATDHVDVIITTGGTGITRRDSTFEAIDGVLEKRLPGFGELFRMLSSASRRLAPPPCSAAPAPASAAERSSLPFPARRTPCGSP